MPWVAVILAFAGLYVALVIYWRFWYFFRDPERIAPPGDNIVAPADGTVIYVRKVEKGRVPVAAKNGKEIMLSEITKLDPDDESGDKYIIGTFMGLLDVHVNRAPISGKVERMSYFSGRNYSMARMNWNKMLRIRPFYKKTKHITQNERNTILMTGKFPVYVVQIADLWVRKIETWIKEGEFIEKGERIGMIKMGSQVDIILPAESMEIKVSEGQHVVAGETVLATYVERKQEAATQSKG